MYDLLVKNGKVITSDGISFVNIAVKDGKIAAILEKDIVPEAKEVIDASGKMVFPGAIDTHSHLNDPGFEWREDFDHGTAAAAVGGYTTIIDMPLQNEPAMKHAKAFHAKLDKVSKTAHVDFCFWGALVDDNFGNLKELDDLGVVAFKSFIGPVSPDYSSLSYGQVNEVMEILEKFDAMSGYHAEDFSMIKWQEKRMKEAGKNTWRDFLDSRPLLAEMIATVNVIEIAKARGAKAHICHVSHPDVADRIREAQDEGYPITAETCTHYLIFTEDDVIEKGALYKCAPPLRTKEDRERMWEHVRMGTFAGISSDHSPCTYAEKFEEMLGNKVETVFDAWGGISGIQSGFQVAFSEGVVKRDICPTTLAYSMSTYPAQVFGIYGKKGDIKVGFDADLLVVDPEKEWEITADSLKYKNKLSAFVGVKGKGLPVTTIVRGKVVAKDGEVVGEKGYGEFVRKIKE